MPDGGFVHGFALNLALVATIGAQNVFILRQALLRQRLAEVITICCLIDAVLLRLGSLGVATIFAAEARVARAVGWAGVAFLIMHSAMRLRSAIGSGTSGPVLESRGTTLASTIAISLLNPQIYLDAFVLLGGVAAQLSPPARVEFALGAVGASLAWFIGFAYGAKMMAASLIGSSFWRLLDIISCGCMAAIALWIGWYQRHDVLELLAHFDLS